MYKLHSIAFCALIAGAPTLAQTGSRVDFDRDVRPILSENCFACHGFDASKRMAGLRLDVRDIAIHRLPSGKTAIVPFDAGKSELVDRVTRTDSLHMPPAYSGKKLKPEQIQTLIRWIAQGAPYAPHWAFVAPKRPPLPRVKNPSWCRNPIDVFILARLEKEGLKPSPQADRRTLIRCVTLDLTGLPPTPKEVGEFLADRRPDAYERLVDRLLASPHYGERMAVPWLDLARYADTNGYHIDNQRFMWRWRDWVIDAFNRNMPYDEFVIEQLAGDLLPNATLDQKIASGFNRNHPITFEGGAIPEEYAAAYVEDRVDVTATAFMGLTMKCAQCHDHKYDPISQREYYRFFAFFNNVPEQGLDGNNGNAAPFIKAPTPDQAKLMDAYNRNIAELDSRIAARSGQETSAVAAWASRGSAQLSSLAGLGAGIAAHYVLDGPGSNGIPEAAGRRRPAKIIGSAKWAASPYGGALELDGNGYVDAGPLSGFLRTDRFSYGAWVFPVSSDAMTIVSHMDDSQDFRGWDLYLTGGKAMVHLIHKWDTDAIRVDARTNLELNKWSHVFVTYDGSGKAAGVHLYINGKPVPTDVFKDSLRGTLATDKPLVIGRRNPSAPFKGMIRDVRLYRRELTPEEVADLAALDPLRLALVADASKRTPEQQRLIADFYLAHFDEEYKRLVAERAELTRKRDALDAAIPTTMVMEEMTKPRDTFILVRGRYDQHGEKVTPGTPACLPPFPKELPLNRLGLAKWLVSPNFPLTARVAVNRFWQEYFGTGLVKTSENFGSQGERPSHPELLDWLATEFMRTGWDVKRMQKLIVTSATYRQSSHVTPALLSRDPENRLLARGPRFRLPAEFIRDQALFLAGLLVDKPGGPPVKPYQPAGLWEEISFKSGFTAQFYEQDHGEALYRRALYTFWKRTCPPPALQTFDAPEREFCVVRRSVTNTPLQALVLMNDPTYVEAARKLAERVIRSAPLYERDRVAYAYRLATCRNPKPAETDVLISVLHHQRDRFLRDRAAAKSLLSVGESTCDASIEPATLAAWTVVMSMILNLDETISKS
ncbi:MAG: DUF1553 domain-containing protein [Chthonomonadales bacterium]